MSLREQPLSSAMPSWASLIRLNLGMTLLGAGAGLSYPFAANLFSASAVSLSALALFCTVPLTGAGILLAASALKKPDLDLFQ